MENHDKEYFLQTEEGLMTHEITPKDRLQNQIRLAADLFLLINSNGKNENESERDFHNRIMNYWNDENYSVIYRDIEQDERFKHHPRLQGDIFKITCEDVIYYKKHQELPEE